MQRLIIFAAVCLIQLTAHAQYPPFTIAGSQVRKIVSTNVPGQEYALHIMLPAGYQQTGQKYPVLYLMDSQWDFPLVTALYGQQYFDGFIPKMIIVGITWGGTNPNPDSLRARDYTPTGEKRLPQSGRAAKFLAFIKNEVFPFVETNYAAANNDRTLVGCSLGGLFTLYALFTEPGLFQRYVASSPAFGWDNEVIYQYEKQYAANTSNPPARLFMNIGGVERSVPGFEKLSRHMNDRRYTALQFKARVLENTGHSGTKGEGYARGLQYVFERPSVRVNPSVLNQYTGTYALTNGSKITVKAEGNQLVLYSGSASRSPLLAASDTSFYSTAEFLRVSIGKDARNVPAKLTIETYGGTQTADRVKQ